MLWRAGQEHLRFLKGIMRIYLAFVVSYVLLAGTTVQAQQEPPISAPPQTATKEAGTPEIIDSPPPPPPDVVLQRPGQVVLHGRPVRVLFRSNTPGLGYQLQLGSSYSAISGVSYGVGYGFGGFGGFGYPYGYGWGLGGVGVAPYYGEVVTRNYQPICVAPCEATLLSGQHHLAVNLQGGPPMNVGTIDLTGNAIVDTTYVNRRKLRVVGWSVFVAGAVSGIAMMFASVNYNNTDFNRGDDIRNRGVFFSGVGILGASIITGSVLAAQRDKASVTVSPR